MTAFLLAERRISLAEFAHLTDWQIAELYFHARDPDGQIEVPGPAADENEAPTSLEAEKIALVRACHALRVAPEVIAAKIGELEEKYARMNAEGPGNGQ